MKRFVSLILSVCFLFSINTVSYAANISSRKASNPVIQSMNDKYHVDFSGMSIDELNKFMHVNRCDLMIIISRIIINTFCCITTGRVYRDLIFAFCHLTTSTLLIYRS